MTTIVAPPWEEQPTAGGETAATVLWANRPSASATPGAEIIVSDLSYQKMYSDGTNWRPVGGRLRLRSQSGLTTSPVATLTGPGLFAVPGGAVVIPAGLLTGDATVTVHADAIETSATSGVLALTGYIGTTNTIDGSNIFASAKTSGTGAQLAISTCVKFISSTSAITRLVSGCGQNANVSSSTGLSSILLFSNFTEKLNTSEVMYVNIGSSNNVAGSISKLVTYAVFVEM